MRKIIWLLLLLPCASLQARPPQTPFEYVTESLRRLPHLACGVVLPPKFAPGSSDISDAIRSWFEQVTPEHISGGICLQAVNGVMALIYSGASDGALRQRIANLRMRESQIRLEDRPLAEHAVAYIEATVNLYADYLAGKLPGQQK